jgi:low temperature requirement protein LtrA
MAAEKTRGDVEGAATDEQRVSSIELFFDLVFVFTLTQLTALLEHEFTPESGVQAVLIFVVLFWMYGGYVWLTNQIPPNGTGRRLLLIAGMTAFLICALSVPDAFDETGLAFGIGYLLVVIVHAALYAETYGAATLRFVPLNIIGALSVIAAGLVHGPVDYFLWLVPVLLQYLTSILARHVDEQSRAGFDIRSGHFVERHGLLLIVAFGESVVAIGIGIGGVPLDFGTISAAVLGLALVAALWWAYFDEDEERPAAALVAASINDRVRMALNAYFYAFIPTLLGIVILAAGVALAIDDVVGPVEPGPALLLGAGVGLYLAGSVAFRIALRIRPIAYRMCTAAAAMTTLVLGVLVAALAQLIGLVILLVAMLAVEARSRAASPD